MIFIICYKDGPPRTATCDKAGSPNDVCPYGQMMSASPNDVAFGNDVVPSAQWANITSLRPSGATSLRTKRVTSFWRKQKHHFYRPAVKYGVTHYTLQNKMVYKKDEKISSFLCCVIKLLYGRHHKEGFLCIFFISYSKFCFLPQRSE